MTQSTLTDIFSSFDQNKAIKHGLPPRAYISNEFYELESDHLFSKSWKILFSVESLLKKEMIQFA